MRSCFFLLFFHICNSSILLNLVLSRFRRWGDLVYLKKKNDDWRSTIEGREREESVGVWSGMERDWKKKILPHSPLFFFLLSNAMRGGSPLRATIQFFVWLGVLPATWQSHSPTRGAAILFSFWLADRSAFRLNAGVEGEECEERKRGCVWKVRRKKERGEASKSSVYCYIDCSSSEDSYFFLFSLIL